MYFFGFLMQKDENIEKKFEEMEIHDTRPAGPDRELLRAKEIESGYRSRCASCLFRHSEIRQIGRVMGTSRQGS
jgi:hypothetical protein